MGIWFLADWVRSAQESTPAPDVDNLVNCKSILMALCTFDLSTLHPHFQHALCIIDWHLSVRLFPFSLSLYTLTVGSSTQHCQFTEFADLLYTYASLLSRYSSWSNTLRHCQRVIMSLSSSVVPASSSASAFASTFNSTPTSTATVTSLPADILLPSRTSYLSSTLTSLTACLTPMLGLMYLAVLSWAWRYSMRNPRALNKTSGVLIQRHAPSP
jgi:hypothetical protein